MFTKMTVRPLFNNYLIELNKATIIIYHALKSQVFQTMLFFFSQITDICCKNGKKRNTYKYMING